MLAPTTPPSNETETKIWSGQPGEYPEVKPWYNGAGSAPSGPPAGKARCSSCIDRYLDNFREMLASKPPSCNCATIPNPPFVRSSSAAAAATPPPPPLSAGRQLAALRAT